MPIVVATPSGAKRRTDREFGARTRHVDDPALALRHHAGNDGLRELERRVHVDFEHDALPLVRIFPCRHVDRGGRVVDQNVDTTVEDLERPGHDAGAAVGVGEIGRDRIDRARRDGGTAASVSLRLPAR